VLLLLLRKEKPKKEKYKFSA
jgi:hypothetical protein